MTEKTLTQSIARNSLGLGLFAILTVGLIASTFVLTEDRIAEQLRAFEARSLIEILPEDTHDNVLIDSRIAIEPESLLKNITTKDAFVAYKNRQPVAVILPATAPDGYSGRIELLVGVNADGSLAGVRVTNHKETPGLGDKIDTKVTDWVLGFSGKSLKNPKAKGWFVKKDGGEFDQFTGATVTPRAVVAAVYRTLQYFDANKETLFSGKDAYQENTIKESDNG